jgi:hypothetical protein
MRAGEELELRVFRALRRMMRDGALGLNPDRCRIEHQRRYFSYERKRPIKVDVAIEIYPMEARTPAIIWVWECKDHAGSLPVGELERFHATLAQLGRDRTKGTIVTSTGVLDPAAWEFAITNGIGIVRIMPDDRIVHTLHGFGIDPVGPLLYWLMKLIDFFRHREGRSWQEYQHDRAYDTALAELRAAQTVPDFESETAFYGVASEDSGPKNHRMLAFELDAFVQNEVRILSGRIGVS